MPEPITEVRVLVVRGQDREYYQWEESALLFEESRRVVAEKLCELANEIEKGDKP